MEPKVKSARISLLIIIIACILYLSIHAAEYTKITKDNNEVLRSYVSNSQEEVNPTIMDEIKSITGDLDKTDQVAISKDYAHILLEKQSLKKIDHIGLKRMNEEYLGWIDIPGTLISYPILYPADNTFYLTHNFKREKSKGGAIFIDANIDNPLGTSNLIIHGHNMKNGSMFGSLSAFRKINYYNKHPFIYIYTENEVYIYQIFSAYVIATSKVEQIYQNKIYTKEDADLFINESKKYSEILTEVDASEDDKFMILSTCTNDSKSRFVVTAVKVKEITYEQ